jgi:hypothetical protein
MEGQTKKELIREQEHELFERYEFQQNQRYESEQKKSKESGQALFDEIKNDVESSVELNFIIDKIRNNTLSFMEVPIKHMYIIGLYYLDKDWVNHALNVDPLLDYLKTYTQRESENFHNLNSWLGEDKQPMDFHTRIYLLGMYYSFNNYIKGCPIVKLDRIEACRVVSRCYIDLVLRNETYKVPDVVRRWMKEIYNVCEGKKEKVLFEKWCMVTDSYKSSMVKDALEYLHNLA